MLPKFRNPNSDNFIYLDLFADGGNKQEHQTVIIPSASNSSSDSVFSNNLELRDNSDSKLGHLGNSEEILNVNNSINDELDASIVPSDNPNVRHSDRLRISTTSTKFKDFHCYLSAILPNHEPRNYKEAASDPRWQEAMKEELDALRKNQTWDRVKLPYGKSAFGCKWVYKIKTRVDSSVEYYKARSVAQDFSQEFSIDYEEAFAPVARMTSFRTLLAVASVRRWHLSQMDVKNAFLNGDLHEEVYMRPPPGFSCSTDSVCRLRRALYGLKQAPRAWFENFHFVIIASGFVKIVMILLY